MPTGPRLVLASSSPRRQQLISLLGLPYQIVTKPVDEENVKGLSPEKVVCELALRKAKAVLEEVR